MNESVEDLGLKQSDIIELVHLKNVSIHVMPENERFVMAKDSSASILDLKNDLDSKLFCSGKYDSKISF